MTTCSSMGLLSLAAHTLVCSELQLRKQMMAQVMASHLSPFKDANYCRYQ